MEQEWPFEGRIRPLRADVLVSLGAVAPLFVFRRPGHQDWILTSQMVRSSAPLDSSSLRGAACEGG